LNSRRIKILYSRGDVPNRGSVGKKGRARASSGMPGAEPAGYRHRNNALLQVAVISNSRMDSGSIKGCGASIRNSYFTIMRRMISVILTVAFFVATVASSVHFHQESDHGDAHQCPVCMFANAPGESVLYDQVIVYSRIFFERCFPADPQIVVLAGYQSPDSRAPPAA
jgi:hypothetical protein